MPVRGRQIEQGDPLGREPGEEMLGRGDHFLVAQHQRGALKQGGPNFFGAGVEADRSELQHPVVRFDPVSGDRVGGVVRELRVFDQHTFTFAGRARGVDDVGERRERQLELRRVGRKSCELFGRKRRFFELENQTRGREPGFGLFTQEAETRPGIRHQVLQPFGRSGRIDGQVGPARLVDAEQHDQQLGGTFERHQQGLLAAQTELQELVRQSVRLRFERVVGEGGPVRQRHHRDGLASERGAGGKTAAYRQLRGRLHRAAAERQQGLLFDAGQEGDFPDPGFGAGGDRREQPVVNVFQAAGIFFVITGAVVNQTHQHVVFFELDVEHQRIAGDLGQFPNAHLKAREDPRLGIIFDHDQVLEKRPLDRHAEPANDVARA